LAAVNFYIDTEFNERGGNFPIDFISIGIVRADGATYYAVSREIDFAALNDWVKQHVMPNVSPDPNEWVRLSLNPNTPVSGVWKTKVQIKQDILAFVGDATPVFIANFADYDHVVLCQLFGAMVDLPAGWPMWTYDVRQLSADYGNPRWPVEDDDKHNALGDSLRLKQNVEWLKDYIKKNPDKYKPYIF